MRKSTRIVLALVVLAAALSGLSRGRDTQASALPLSLQGVWVATPDWIQCDQSSQASECAEWQTLDGGIMVMTCCVPPEALGTSDRSACVGGGRFRSRTEL